MSRTFELELRCKDHKRYQALRKCRCGCPTCQTLYDATHAKDGPTRMRFLGFLLFLGEVEEF